MSIVRVGLAETKNFSEGYELIFGKKNEENQPAKTEEKLQSNEQQCEQKQKE